MVAARFELAVKLDVFVLPPAFIEARGLPVFGFDEDEGAPLAPEQWQSVPTAILLGLFLFWQALPPRRTSW